MNLAKPFPPDANGTFVQLSGFLVVALYGRRGEDYMRQRKDGAMFDKVGRKKVRRRGGGEVLGDWPMPSNLAHGEDGDIKWGFR